MKITVQHDDGKIEGFECEQFYLMLLEYRGVMNEETGKTFTAPQYHHRTHGDLRELMKELSFHLEDQRAQRR